jgi:hypothetical protein
MNRSPKTGDKNIEQYPGRISARTCKAEKYGNQRREVQMLPQISLMNMVLHETPQIRQDQK